MKILHLADLHIGRRFHDVSLLEDQEFMLNKIIGSIEEQSIDIVIIAGDIYDKTNPSEGSFDLWDRFLVQLSELKCTVICISGNHDSQQRLSFGSQLFENHNIHIVAPLNQEITPIEVDTIRFYPIPFIRPSMVRNVHESFAGTSYEEAYSFLVDSIGTLDSNYTNILIGHQYFIYGDEVKLSDSETLSLGGSEAINITLLKDFDYVACGHIHRSQQIGLETRRYSGSLLKYSFSESDYNKRFPILSINDNEIEMSSLELQPLRDVRVLEGPFDEIIRTDTSQDFIKVILSDATEIHDAIGRLRSHFPNLLTIENNSSVFRSNPALSLEEIKTLDPLEMIQSFYLRQNQDDLNEYQTEDLLETITRLEEVK